MWPLVHEKLDGFLEQGITVPVEEPMDWMSSLAYSWEANGKFRVCLDPRDVNKAIKPSLQDNTIEEIQHQLARSKKFTKVDGTSSYLCIVFNYESSLLTMFNTPWRRYRFVHLLWGLTCAFQWMMDQILGCCEGVMGIADDVIIHGKDDEEHNWNLHRFMHVTLEYGLVFNGDKCEVKKDSVTFFGTVYDADGVHPDPKKVDAVHQMPPPETSSQLQQYKGIVTYLSPFIQSLSTHTASLWELLKKDSEFKWNTSYQEAFDRIKELVCKDTTLHYLMYRSQSPSKSMHQERNMELHFSGKDIQLPLPQRLSPLQCKDMPT